MLLPMDHKTPTAYHWKSCNTRWWAHHLGSGKNLLPGRTADIFVLCGCADVGIGNPTFGMSDHCASLFGHHDKLRRFQDSFHRVALVWLLWAVAGCFRNQHTTPPFEQLHPGLESDLGAFEVRPLHTTTIPQRSHQAMHLCCFSPSHPICFGCTAQRLARNRQHLHACARLGCLPVARFGLASHRQAKIA